VPKMKTHRAATKRFKVKPSGKIVRRKAFANHILGKKPSKRKRRLSTPGLVSAPDQKRVRRVLGE
jgi:large subunit ribosomal protein L35